MKDYNTITDYAVHIGVTIKKNLNSMYQQNPDLNTGEAMDYLWNKVTYALENSDKGKEIKGETRIIMHMAEDILVLKHSKVRSFPLKDFLSGEFRNKLTIGELLSED